MFCRFESEAKYDMQMKARANPLIYNKNDSKNIKNWKFSNLLEENCELRGIVVVECLTSIFEV